MRSSKEGGRVLLHRCGADGGAPPNEPGHRCERETILVALLIEEVCREVEGGGGSGDIYSLKGRMGWDGGM